MITSETTYWMKPDGKTRFRVEVTCGRYGGDFGLSVWSPDGKGRFTSYCDYEDAAKSIHSALVRQEVYGLTRGLVIGQAAHDIVYNVHWYFLKNRPGYATWLEQFVPEYVESALRDDG